MNFRYMYLMLCVAFISLFTIRADHNQISVLIKNKYEVGNNNIKNVSFVSVPFSGHFNILMKSALNLAQEKKYRIKFVITGWENITVAPESLSALRGEGIEVDVLNDAPLASPAPMKFTLTRTAHLVDKAIAVLKDSDVIVYDFFALEGYFAGISLSVPTICSIPAIIGTFNPKNEQFQKGIQENLKEIELLSKKFDTPVLGKLEMVSDAFLLPSESENLIWSWPTFIESSNYQLNRKLKNVTFMRPEREGVRQQFNVPVEPGQKLIYVSLGTVVTKNLWNNVPAVRMFVTALFDELVRGLGNKNDYVVVVSTGREPHTLIPNPPKNFHLFESVPQEAVLTHADLFITHGGGNSVNEAIDLEVPMLVIPFFGDQHVCAENVQNLGLGVSFLHPENKREAAINTESGFFDRPSLNPRLRLVSTIEKALGSEKEFKENFKKVKESKPVSDRRLICDNFVFKWREGDLLYGINADRKAFVARLGLDDHFRIGDFRPFSELFADNCKVEALPRLIDQYHDVMRSPDYKTEVAGKKFLKYKQHLTEYHAFLHGKQEYLKPIGAMPSHLPPGDSPELETLWNMCLGGLEFFLAKGSKVHFAIKDYNSKINKATTKEIQWLRAHWAQKEVRQNVTFYLMKHDTISIVDPEKYDWFVHGTTPTRCKHFVLISKPGSGKGTFSEYLGQKYGYISISPGDIFRSEIYKQTEFGKKIQPIIEKGDYVADDIVRQVIANKIDEILKEHKSFILEGYPHSEESFKLLHALFLQRNLSEDVCFIHLDASDEICMKRILDRRVCKQCSHIYNLSSASSRLPNICDYCSGELLTRHSDTPEIIKKRLAQFQSQITPIMHEVQKWYTVKTIDTDRPLQDLKKIYDGLM